MLEAEPCVVIVSGLPRSGTSLLMQMLQAGGIKPLTDHTRIADKHNPRGYLELERVKHLAADNTWLDSARGMAIKVVAPLVPFLPRGIPYKILFVNRDINEILESQNRMLEEPEKDISATIDMPLAMDSLLSRAIDFARNHPQTLFKIIEHRDLISCPLEVSKSIQAFLGNSELDLRSMASVVDPSLYRNRHTLNR